jgi:hypothetical protein
MRRKTSSCVPHKGLYAEAARLEGGTGLANVLVAGVAAAPSVGDDRRALALRCAHEYLARVDRHLSHVESLALAAGVLDGPLQLSSSRSSSSTTTASTTTTTTSSAPAPPLPRAMEVFAESGGFDIILGGLRRVCDTQAQVAAQDSSERSILSTPSTRSSGELSATYSVLLEMAVADYPRSGGGPEAMHHVRTCQRTTCEKVNTPRRPPRRRRGSQRNLNHGAERLTKMERKSLMT